MIEAAPSLVCIGYGFNDAHVQPKLLDAAKTGVPLLVLTKQLSAAGNRELQAHGRKLLVLESAGAGRTLVRTAQDFAGQSIDGEHWTIDALFSMMTGGNS